MSLIKRLRGTIENLFQIGVGGPNLKNVSGSLEIRTADDSALAPLKGATATQADEYITKAMLDAYIPISTSASSMYTNSTGQTVQEKLDLLDATDAVLLQSISDSTLWNVRASSSGSQTQLTDADKHKQLFDLSGSGDIKLPTGITITKGWEIEFSNPSTWNLIVQADNAATVKSINAQRMKVVANQDNPTTVAHWDIVELELADENNAVVDFYTAKGFSYSEIQVPVLLTGTTYEIDFALGDYWELSIGDAGAYDIIFTNATQRKGAFALAVTHNDVTGGQDLTFPLAKYVGVTGTTAVTKSLASGSSKETIFNIITNGTKYYISDVGFFA